MIAVKGERQLKQMSAGRFGEPPDIAGFVKLLCSKEASYVTGETLGIDGGMFKVQNPGSAYAEAGRSAG